MIRALSLALLLAAAPALAQSQGPALRGTVTAPPPAADPAVATPFYSPLAPAPTAAAQGAPQCRLSCAQNYYFCLSGEDSADCGTTWAQCRSRCDAPSVAPADAFRAG